MKILIINNRYAWCSIWDSTFLMSSQISLMLLILKIKKKKQKTTHQCLFPTSRDSDLIGMKLDLNIWTFNPPGQSLRSTALEKDISKLSDQKTC